MPTNVKFAPRRLGHLNLFVSDVERSAAFYRDVCGFKEVFREPEISMIFMTNGNTHHDLGLMEITPEDRVGRDGHVQVRPGAGKTPGLNHLGFEMQTEAALVDAYRRALKQKVPVSRTTDHQIAHSVYLSECNGHFFEFYADIIEDFSAFYAENQGALISGHWDPEQTAPSEDARFPKDPDLFKSNDAVLTSRNVAYAGLPVKDLQASIDYYADVLGLNAVQVDHESKFAVLEGSAQGGCDVCLMETTEFPATRLLFGGVNLHDGKALTDALKVLESKRIPASFIGDTELSCIVVLDPDRIPLVYSTSPAGRLMARHGPAVVAEIRRLWASNADEANAATL
ncbi:VOC family protein [Alcaligenaceae bacterium]|nr:VOC family protein [Alcaligenaceae bacterium]